MQAGSLDKRIRIERRIDTQDPYGEPIPTWELFADVAANVKALDPRERPVAQQLVGLLDTEFRIRWIPGVDETMRVVYSGRVYDIAPPVEIGRRDGLLLFGVAKGRL